ncbi:T9SS type B sorting domain-containing protein [Algibacter sp. R77976]|uniref:T9SS type B sorting domain-containing protein n=1 Tax=Algibacter sp. R77976 TaxID=3093873 RepID=UPI0037C5679F
MVRAGSFCSTQPGGTIPINVRFEIWDSTDTNLLANGNTGNITETPSPIWSEYGLVFQTLAGQNEVLLKMINNGLGGCGNDLAIDDIEFKSCGDFVAVPDTSNNNSVAICSSQAPYTSTLTANPDFSVYTSHFYQWQESPDGITWNDMVGETNQSISISTSITNYYRTKIAEVAVNLSNPQCVSFSNEYEVIVNQLPAMPTIKCWETATVNNASCSWEVTGTQQAQPPVVNCWDNYVFNTTSCKWENNGVQETEPTPVNCWDSFTFNSTSCTWENIGTQDIQPAKLNCWDNYVFNTTSCTWENSGVQEIEPAPINCWDSFTFNSTSCTWENIGTQDVQPDKVNCWDNYVFNTTSCTWENNGVQDAQPVLECWETAMFNAISCVWEVTGIKPGGVFNEDINLCEDENVLLETKTNILNPTYIWNTGETTENIIIDSPGNFSVEISDAACTFETRNFNVTKTVTPIIESVVSDGHDIIITTANTGNFLYSLDGTVFQSNNTFSNVEGGLYTVFVRADNCIDIASVEHLHFYIPAFFTPNNDGINDTFNLVGIEFYESSEVFIYDRYGKLLKYTRNDYLSWDGTFKNEYLPTNDYWYVVIIEGQKFTGHVALKR